MLRTHLFCLVLIFSNLVLQALPQLGGRKSRGKNNIEGRNFGAGNCCCRVVNGLFTTVISCFLRTRVKGSVTPLM